MNMSCSISLSNLLGTSHRPTSQPRDCETQGREVGSTLYRVLPLSFRPWELRAGQLQPHSEKEAVTSASHSKIR